MKRQAISTIAIAALSGCALLGIVASAQAGFVHPGMLMPNTERAVRGARYAGPWVTRPVSYNMFYGYGTYTHDGLPSSGVPTGPLLTAQHAVPSSAKHSVSILNGRIAMATRAGYIDLRGRPIDPHSHKLTRSPGLLP